MAKQTRSKKRSTEKSTGIGFGYFMKLTIVISLLMMVNSYLVGRIVQANVGYIPDVFDDVRLYQFFQIFVPIIMICIQFWIFDRLCDSRLGRLSERAGATPGRQG